jgi:hypothetical protein
LAIGIIAIGIYLGRHAYVTVVSQTRAVGG